MRGYANAHLVPRDAHGQRIDHAIHGAGVGRRTIKQEAGWQKIRVELEVPPGTATITYGFLLESGGRLRIRGVTLERAAADDVGER